MQNPTDYGEMENPMAQLLRERLATYKDSYQTKVEMELKDFGFFKTNLPRLYARELEHNLMITVNGPDGLENQARECFQIAAGAGVLSGLAAAFAGAGLGALGAAGTTAAQTLSACLAGKASIAVSQVEVRFDDDSHWSDWHPV
jgi:hypothetical protein